MIKKIKQHVILFIVFLGFFFLSGCNSQKKAFLKKELAENFDMLCNDIVSLQNSDSTSPFYGAFYCKACSSAEAVLPLVADGKWLIKQQQPDGSWYSTPTKWTGTTTDQVLTMSAAYKLIKDELTPRTAKRSRV